MKTVLEKNNFRNPAEMVLGIKNRDIPGFEVLYDQYAPPLFGWILNKVKDKRTAEKILSDTFLNMWSNIGQYDGHKCSFLIWLMQLSCKEISRQNLKPE